MTPIHVRAQPGDVAGIVLLVGDPGRATRTAEFLDRPRSYNEYRGLLGYTGEYAARRVSVQTTGMGCPSAAIVCEELAMLGARVLIRMGTCGALQPKMRATDVVIATAAHALDGTTVSYLGPGERTPSASARVVDALRTAVEEAGVRHHVGVIATEDALYAVRENWTRFWRAKGILAQEMEASAIFVVAELRGMEAGCVLVASNHAGQHERLPDAELQPAIDAMIRIGLEAAVTLTPERP